MSNVAGTTNPNVEWLSVVGDRATWRLLGLTVTDDGFIPLVGTSIQLIDGDPQRSDVAVDGASAPEGIVGWALSGVHGSHGSAIDIDGLPTNVVEPMSPRAAVHDLGVSGLDHVVVLTSDLVRTSAAVADATGCDLKRVREVGAMRQGFHRIGRGGLIVELVERPEVPDGPANFWGLVLNVNDLDAACELIGPDRISPPKDAVQPGRRIATVRSCVGLGMPLALMTP